MKAKIQIQPDYVFLFDNDNKIIKSERKPASGDTIMALARLRTWAKRQGYEVTS
jgi:hypothetical protein